MGLVNKTIDTSLRVVRAYVHEYLSAHLAEARQAIQEYGNRYTSAMLRAVDTSRQGALSSQEH